MTKLYGFCAALALSTGLAMPGWAETTAPAPDAPAAAAATATTADTVLATVNGTDITLGDVIVTRESLPAQYKSLPDDQLFKGILDQLIQQEALKQSFGDTLSKQQTVAIDGLKRSYLSNEALLAGIKDATSDDAIQKAYDAKYKAMAPTLEYHAAHILVDSEDKAKELLTEIEGGKAFAEVAKANSKDGSAANGGDLGWFSVGAMVKPFEDAVVAAPIGKVVGPIKTDFGWHLILVSETRNKAAPALADVHDEIAADLQKAAIGDFIKSITEKATVTRTDISGIDPAVIKDLTLFDK
ncbi:MAG: peptidylprolyl isomerase [Cypionkella sp.]